MKLIGFVSVVTMIFKYQNSQIFSHYTKNAHRSGINSLNSIDKVWTLTFWTSFGSKCTTQYGW